MFRNTAIRTLLLIGLGWAVVLLGFQALVPTRFHPQRPDHVFNWTEQETLPGSHRRQPYLLDPFLNTQVAWDSEFYLSIATVGYDDPAVRTTQRPGIAPLSLNYAFFPLYPLAIRVAAFPLWWIGMGRIAGATLAGLLISVLGALGAAVALYDLSREELGESGAIRTAFYLLIFPTGFFLAQIYTEGLFVGLAFGSLALLRRRQWVWAALLAALATWTRAVGGALLFALLWTWVADHGAAAQQGRFSKAAGWQLGLAFSPLVAYGIWFVTLGGPFHTVEELFFGRGMLQIGHSWDVWTQAWGSLFGGNLQTRFYYLLEFASIALGMAACWLTARRYPEVAGFGALVILISLTSGVSQGMSRYVLAVPSIFVALGRWGEHPAFDRVWTLASALLMAVLALLFSFDFWVG